MNKRKVPVFVCVLGNEGGWIGRGRYSFYLCISIIAYELKLAEQAVKI